MKDALGVDENKEIKPKLLLLLQRCDVALAADTDLAPAYEEALLDFADLVRAER